MKYFHFEHLWSDLSMPFISQSSKRAKAPTTIFLLHVFICLPVLLHKVKATWKYIYKLTSCKIMVSLLGDCSFNYVLPPPPVFIFLFGWAEKVLFHCKYLIHGMQYKQIQGNRDYSSNSARKENSMPGLLHQYIIIPSRINRIILLPRKRKKWQIITSYKPSQDLF